MEAQEALTPLKATEGLWQAAPLARAGGLLGGSNSNSARDYQVLNKRDGVHMERGKLPQELFKSNNQQHVGLTKCGGSGEGRE